MSWNTASPVTQPATGARPGVLSDALQAIASLFEITRPGERTRVVHLWWLAALTVAGAAVRFWGLGSVGLHGDEETMAMAVRHILVDGTPILPSGMFYPRGVTQLYLMALSTAVFGESEWALRLPSALCGTALIGLSYALGRRFLQPRWCVALAGAVAFLPELIVYSQTARMYIFLVSCVAASMLCLFHWERTDRMGALIGAVAFLIVGLDMQLLAVGSILIFLIPGLLTGDARKLTLGASAAAVVAIAFLLVDLLTSAQYPVPPPEFSADLGPPPWERSWAPPAFALAFDIVLGLSGLAIAFFVLHLCRAITHRPAAWICGTLLLVGLGLQLVLFYHLAAIVYLAGIVLAWRFRSAQLGRRLAIFILAVAVVALIHATLLASTPGSIIKLVGAMVGQPSVWPYVRVARFSEVAGVLTAVLLLWGLYQFTQRRRASDVWLLALLGVVAPVFALGIFAWNLPTRYTAMALPSLLLCAFAVAQRGTDWLLAHRAALASRLRLRRIAPAAVAILVINPPAAAAVIDAGYGLYPDHKGAAEFMRSLPVTDDDIVLAEDVLQQTYYLGKVDYWLIGPQVARKFVKRAENGVVDFYTGTPVIVSPAMLDKLLLENAQRRIFVIGSGEGQKNNRRTARGEELHEAIESERFETIFIGRDGLTRVLRAVPSKVPLHEYGASTVASTDSEAPRAQASTPAR